MIPAEAVEAATDAAKGSFDGKPPRGMRAAIRLALEAAAPHMQGDAENAPPVTPRPCLERHSHPDPAYMCMAPEGHT